jgi:hypothetical protein
VPLYSLLITSCNRHDLLQTTLETFIDCCAQYPREIVIVEDGPTPMPVFLQKYKHLGLRYLNNGERRGQIYSCDRLWRECSTDLAFWSEDDWYYSNGGFINESFDILAKYPEVITVSLRGDWNHPLVSDSRYPFKIAQPNWREGWGGFMFNPGARRKYDYTLIGSYGKHVGYGHHGLGHELELSKLYASMGYVIGALPDHICHIGAGRSRAIEPLSYTPPKVLVGIKAGHALKYGKWESGDSPLYDPSIAYKNQPYGKDIHMSLPVNPRIQAIRDTWWKDLKGQPNTTGKFFFGEQAKDGAKRQPLEDEVFLPVPDDYAHLPQKTIAICKYARENNYDYVFLCDDDTLVYVDRLLLELAGSPFADYAGYLSGDACTGGTGYWLSKHALTFVQDNPKGWAEDMWVSQCMFFNKIAPMHLPGHRCGPAHWFFGDKFTPSALDDKMTAVHAVQPEVMRAWYNHKEKSR